MSEFYIQIPDEVKLGLDAFSVEAFYTAHEHFEDAWRNTHDDSREFFRALLHISGGFYRLTQARHTAAEKFFKHAINWLAFFPSPYWGFKIDDLIFHLEKIIETIKQKTPCDVILKENFDSIRSILDLRTS